MDDDDIEDRNQFQQLAPLVFALREAGLPTRWARSDLAVELMAEGIALDKVVWRLKSVFEAGTIKDEVYHLSAHDTALRRFESLLHLQGTGQLSATQAAELEESRAMVDDETKDPLP
ncbi:hypothetical protein [Silvimonas soli]|uniref:hypothetical protein n=1 Tax=Silvimonas soli TaxID=2980100 RepID=UPI0024B3B70A|nr:hypothetical protein [Silvimonas soli]